MMDRRVFAAADPSHFGADLVLPRPVACQQHDGPCEQKRGCLVPGEEERLALVHDHLHARTISTLFPFRRLNLVQQHSEQIVAVRAAPTNLGTVFSALDYLRQEPLHLCLRCFDLLIVFGGKEPAEIFLILSQLTKILCTLMVNAGDG